jgi:hypothetical protein
MGATTAQYSLSFDSAKARLPKSVGQWAEDIHAHARLPDARLQRRLVNITKTLACFPTDSLPHACADWAQTKGAYRFIENDRLAPEDLHDGLPKSTALRCAGLKVVYSVQDTTETVFPKACHAEGLGRINSSPSRGALLHSAVGMSPDGLLLGILHMHSWCRKDDGKTARDRANRPIEKKESVRWLNAMRGAHEAIAELPPELRPVLWHVGDREMDIHEVFALAESLGDPVVVRWARDRRIENGNKEITKAHQSVAKSPRRGVVEIQVPRTRTKPARTAIVEIRFERQTLKPGKGNPRQRGRGPIPLWLIELREMEPPKGEKPLLWLLWANRTVDSLADAVQIIDIYRKRWRIEDYHLVLKEGCRLEKVRFHTAHRIRLAIALYAPVAVRIVAMRDAARLYPDAPCTILLDDTEWRVLWTTQNKGWPADGQAPPTLQQAVKWIGRLGGHLGRKGDGMPGVKTLWRGFRDLQLLTDYEKRREWLRSQGLL